MGKKWEPPSSVSSFMEIFKVYGSKETRSGFGDALYELGQKDERVVALSADLSHSVKMTKFINAFPERFFQCGIAEANMIGVAAGLATCGFIPFVGTFAVFATGRVFDQIRQSVCYSRKNVKICASHSGLTLGEDGASHQILEDIALMRSLPEMAVFAGADYYQTYKLTFIVYKHQGPAYLRFSRPSTPQFIPTYIEFEPYSAFIMKYGKDLTIFVTGLLTYHVIQAVSVLSEYGIDPEVINIYCIKPLDVKSIIESVKKTGAGVVVEEHQINGGLGDAIANVVCRHHPVPLEFVAVQDTFGESGKPDELLDKYMLTTPYIVKAALRAVERKNTHIL